MPFAELNNSRIFYDRAGQGEPVIFIHGLGSSSKDWQFQKDFFAQSFDVILPDLRGHGESSRSSHEYSIPIFAEETVELLDFLKIKKAHFVGISLGGMVCLEIGSTFQQYCSSLTIINSIDHLKPRSLRHWLFILSRYGMILFGGIEKFGRVLAQRLFPKAAQTELRNIFAERFKNNSKEAYLRTFRGMIGWSVRAKLPKIYSPTLVISGDRDYTSTKSKEEYTKLIPNAQLVEIVDSGHASPCDQPLKTNAAILSFLNSLGSGLRKVS